MKQHLSGRSIALLLCLFLSWFGVVQEDCLAGAGGASVSDEASLTASERAAVDGALQLIALVGGEMPPSGTKYCSGKISGSPAGAAKPGGIFTSDKIWIDFKKIKAKLAKENGGTPPVGAPGMPGVIAGIIMHEAHHLNGTGGSACDEYTIAASVAEDVAMLIMELKAAGSTNFDPLCVFYNRVQRLYNAGRSGVPGCSAPASIPNVTDSSGANCCP